MGRLLKKLFLFLGLLCVANVLLVCVGGELLPTEISKHFLRYKRYGGGHLFTRLEEARKVDSVDILFIGTSHCYRGLDPRIFKAEGYSSFNLGSSIQTAIQTELLLDRYLDSLRPERVIFEVNPTIFGSDGAESATDVISNDHIDWRTVQMVLNVNRYKVYNTMLFGLYRQWTGIGMDLSEPLTLNRDRYIPGGFVESKRNENRSEGPILPSEYTFDEDQLDAFDNVVTMLNDRDIPFVLIQTPITRKLYLSKTNNDQVDSLLNEKGRYYNFNTIIAMDDRYDFFDTDHLTQQGVQKFNVKLIEVLEKDRFLE